MKYFADDKEATAPRVPSGKVEVIKSIFYGRHHDLVKRFMSLSDMTQYIFCSLLAQSRGLSLNVTYY